MSLVNPKQFIISARSNGYKDTSYAIAELADNSIQARASEVEVILFENENRTINEIAIADNGDGMSRDMLALALGFGESGRDKDTAGNLQNSDTKGMGKFGMGLPNASVSQCKRVEVWSWTSAKDIYFSYLDVDEIIDGDFVDLPTPKKTSIPQKYRNALFGGCLPEHGTLVVWSKLDKLKWKRATTLFEKSEFEIGRMYRRFISEKSCSVKFKVCDVEGKEKNNAIHGDGFIKANDPLYLTENSSLPTLPPFHDGESQTFFEVKEDYQFTVYHDGKEHEIKLKSSVARSEVIHRILQNGPVNKAGDTEWGKHCAKNIGLSVLRAGRELEIISKDFFGKGDLYQVRFLGVEIEIPPSLDEVFGVTNNKQHAHKLKDITGDMDINDENGNRLDNEDKILAFLKKNEEDDTAILYEVGVKLKNLINNAKRDCSRLNLTKANPNDAGNTLDDRAGIIINAGFKKRNEVHSGTTFSNEPNYPELEANLVKNYQYSVDEAEKVVNKMRDLGTRITIQYRSTANHAFFEVENLQGLTVLVINPEHELYKNYLGKMQEHDQYVFKVILGAWALLEDGSNVENTKRQLERARNEWGETIEQMFAELEFPEDDTV